MVRIATNIPLTDPQRKLVFTAGEAEIVEIPPRTETEKLLEMIVGAEVWFGFRIRKDVVKRATDLRWIQTISAGVDGMLFPEMLESDVILTNVRGMHAETIADHVFALILAFARELPFFLNRQREKQWDRREVRSLAGTKLAVVGMGGIGAEVARRGVAFGMQVVGTVRHPRKMEGIEQVYPPEKLDEAIAGAEWVVIAAPLTTETVHLIRRDQLKLMGPKSVLINIGRGRIVDEAALIESLQTGEIAGAGLDVVEDEPLSPDSPLWRMENVIITPHIAGSMDNYIDRALEIFGENLRRYRAGEPLMNVVDKKLGY